MSESDQKEGGGAGGTPFHLSLYQVVIKKKGALCGAQAHPPFPTVDEGDTRAPREGGVCARPLARSRLKPDGARPCASRPPTVVQ